MSFMLRNMSKLVGRTTDKITDIKKKVCVS